MLKKQNPGFTVGSLFICNKCSKSFKPEAKQNLQFAVEEFAENLKTELRQDLKEIEAHKKVRVMVSGCLSVCDKGEQAFAYYPNQLSESALTHQAVEMFSTSDEIDHARNDILNLIKTKVN